MVDNDDFLESMIDNVDNAENLLINKLIDCDYYLLLINKPEDKFKIFTSNDSEEIDYIYSRIFYDNWRYMLNYDLADFDVYIVSEKNNSPFKDYRKKME